MLPKVCAWITVITFTEIYWILPMYSNVTIKNVSWPHFSWPTLYWAFCSAQKHFTTFPVGDKCPPCPCLRAPRLWFPFFCRLCLGEHKVTLLSFLPSRSNINLITSGIHQNTYFYVISYRGYFGLPAKASVTLSRSFVPIVHDLSNRGKPWYIRNTFVTASPWFGTNRRRSPLIGIDRERPRLFWTCSKLS